MFKNFQENIMISCLKKASKLVNLEMNPKLKTINFKSANKHYNNHCMDCLPANSTKSILDTECFVLALSTFELTTIVINTTICSHYVAPSRPAAAVVVAFLKLKNNYIYTFSAVKAI